MKYITYFDYLGFKDFIDNNNLEYQKKIISNIFRDIERALGKGKYIETNYGVISDISQSKINCLNFSDTIVFWTNDDSIESLNELLIVSHTFNWQAIDYFFPVRGSVVYGEIMHIDFRQPNGGGGVYNINSLFGKGLVKAHQKAESQNWAGTVIDGSIIDILQARQITPAEFLEPYAKKYKVPYKNGIDIADEYVFWITKGKLNDEAFKNIKSNIEKNFADHNKSIDDIRTKEKLDNTIKYLESFR